MEDMDNVKVRSVEEIPLPFREVFSEYMHFNSVQSEVLDDILYSDDSVVISSPTGSGKTTIFELAVVKLLIQYASSNTDFKIVYISPIKSLCQERLVDWTGKFSGFGINCVCVTGDSENVDFQNLSHHNLIISTPEKWDSLTRKWREHEKLVRVVKLFMIDEVHLLNEEDRGSTLEVIVSRMKTVQNSISLSEIDDCQIRFIAVSATIGNVEDIAEWIGSRKCFRFPEEIRPVQLKKLVLGFNCNQNPSSAFKFDLSLNYRLQNLLIQYSEGKPTLIFCSTRKSVEMTAKHLVQTLKIKLDPSQLQRLQQLCFNIPDVKVKEIVKHGIGVHHAGMDLSSRHIIEDIFRGGDLPILVTTSTLAMGVNLPAHLVIIKSTKHYSNGSFQDYSAISLHQMIGRAGRPQFDTSATALILTTNEDKNKIEKMLSSTEPVESNLHRHLTEHLNAEVVLGTITGLDVALQWLASTFLYIRARINPRHYGLSLTYKKEQLDKKLLEMFQIDLNKLVRAGMITMDEDINVSPTMTGRLMARYYVDFETMKMFTQITGTEIFIQILALISKCQEFSEMRLRVNDKKTLNLLNSNTKKATIRFPLNGKIKTWDMKVNCIIQAVLGNLEITDVSIQTESYLILRNGQRIIKCLIHYLAMRKQHCYLALLNSIILAKCLNAKLWEDSPFVSKQLTGIGSILATQLANAKKDTFAKILESNPRDLEMIVKRKPPFGDYLVAEVKYLPKFSITLKRIGQSLQLTILLENADVLQHKSTLNQTSLTTLIVGNNLNETLIYEMYQMSYMLENRELTKFISLSEKNLESIEAHFINEDWVGVDCSCVITLEKENKVEVTSGVPKLSEKCPNSKQSSYIQTFLDIYMKIKKPEKSKKHDKNSNLNIKRGNLNTTTLKRKQKDENTKTGKVISKIDGAAEKLDKMYDELLKNKVENVIKENESLKYLDANTDIIYKAEKFSESAEGLEKTSSLRKLLQADDFCQNITTREKVSKKPELSISDLYDLPDDNIQPDLSIADLCDIPDRKIPQNEVNEYSNKPKNEQPIIVDKDKCIDESVERNIEQKPEEHNRCEEIVFSATDVQEYEEIVHSSNDGQEFEGKDICSNGNSKIYVDLQEVSPKETATEAEKSGIEDHKNDFNSLTSNDSFLYSLSHKYVTDEIIDERNLAKPASRGLKKNVILRNILNRRGKKKKKLIGIHPAEELEDQIVAREQDKKEYLEMFKKPQKKKMNHNYNDNVPDSTVTSHTYKVSQILEPEMQRQGSKNADYYSENQKNIKWRSPLVFSPGIKFSPKVHILNVSRENVESEMQNESHNESFDTSPTVSSKALRHLGLNVQKTPKRSKNDNNIFKQAPINTTPLPLSDKDYEFSQDNRKSKEVDNIEKFSDICSTQLLDSFKMKHKTNNNISRKLTQNNPTSTTDYYSQLIPLTKRSKLSPKEKKELHRLQGNEKENLKDNEEDAENYEPDLPNKKSKVDLNSSRMLFGSQNERDFSENELDIILSQNRPRTYERIPKDFRTRSEEYIDAKIRNNYPVYPDFDIPTTSRHFQPTPFPEYCDYDEGSRLNSSFRSVGRPIPKPLHYSSYVDPVHVNFHPNYGQYAMPCCETPGDVVRRSLPRHGYVGCEMRPLSRNVPQYGNVEARCAGTFQVRRLRDFKNEMATPRRTMSPEEYPELRQTPMSMIQRANPPMTPSRHIYRDAELIDKDLNGSFVIRNSTYPVNYRSQNIPCTVSHSQIPDQNYLEYFPRGRHNVLPYDFTPDTCEYQQHSGIDKDYVMNKYMGSLNSSE